MNYNKIRVFKQTVFSFRQPPLFSYCFPDKWTITPTAIKFQIYHPKRFTINYYYN